VIVTVEKADSIDYAKIYDADHAGCCTLPDFPWSDVSRGFFSGRKLFSSLFR